MTDEIPLFGRLWLPPDCELASALLLKLVAFHEGSSNAEECGPEHVEKHKQNAMAAAKALGILFSE